MTSTLGGGRQSRRGRELSEKQRQLQHAADFEAWKKRVFAEGAKRLRRESLKHDSQRKLKRKIADQKARNRKEAIGKKLEMSRKRQSSESSVAHGRLVTAISNEVRKLDDTYWNMRAARERRRRERKLSNAELQR